MIIQSSKAHKQKGATLVVSLVILTMVTVLGIASMRNSNLELKMAASARDHSVAFQNAESALRIVEESISQITQDQVENACTNAAGCFDATCTNGLCFDGVFSSNMAASECELSSSGQRPKQMWKDKTIWETTGLHGNIVLPGSSDDTVTNTVGYLIEFLCFALPEGQSADQARSDGYPLFRITVRAEGEAGRSTSMLQSVYRGTKLYALVGS